MGARFPATGLFVVVTLALAAATADAAALRGRSALRSRDPVPNLDDDGTYKYYDSSRDPDSPAYVSPSIRYQWKHSTLSRWDVGNPLPQSAPVGTVLQSKDGTPTDFWPTPLNPPAYTSEKVDGGAFVG